MLELLLYDKKNEECRIVTAEEDIEKLISEPGTVKWLNVEKPSERDMNFMQNNLKFHPLAVEDCMTAIQRPKIDRYDGYLFIVLHAASLGSHKDKATSLEVDFFLGNDFLVTVHMKPIKSIITSRDRCMKNQKIIAEGPGHIFYNIADALADNYFPILDKLDSDIEEMEELMFKDHSVDSINRILWLKESVLTLRRFIGPQREIVNCLARGDYQPLVSKDLLLYFRDISDLLAHISDTLDSYRDIFSSIFDGYTSVSSHRMNEVMKVLTIIATIAMPLTLISGIYGMNFKNMPELDWNYGYYFSLALMLAIGVGMVTYFKYKKWL